MSQNWTSEQKQAIETIDRDLLVSAAAGSGKTAVLAERFAYLVCDAPDFCDVDEILVVTFTNDAAAEMKRRIARAINKKLTNSFDNRLKRQAMLIHSAHISTIHGMASSILRRHFHEVGIDPNFRLLNEEESRLMRSEIVSKLLEETIESSNNDALRITLRDYCDGRVDTMKKLILSIHAKLSSLLDPWNWLNGKIDELKQSADQNPLKSRYGQLLLAQIKSQHQALLHTTTELLNHISALPEVEKYLPTVNGVADMLLAAVKVLKTDDWENIRKSIYPCWPKLPTITSKSTQAEKIKARIDDLKFQVTKLIENNLFDLSEARLIEGLKANHQTAQVLAELVKAFEDRYQREKGESSSLDFNDLERFTLNLLRVPGSSPSAPSQVAIEYQNQFKHIMVDEYQDVNELQETILTLLSAGGKHFAVGDVKQSIYRFRQADPRCFIRRRERYLAGDPRLAQVIDLQKNFRSRGPILDVLNLLFEKLMTRQSAEIDYDNTQKLFAGANYPQEPGCFSGMPLELHLIDAKGTSDDHAEELESTEREAVLAAGRIRELLGHDGQARAIVSERDGSTRPIEPRDIVILLRSAAKKAEIYANMLRRAGIPVQADSKTGFFAAIEVLDLINLLKLLCNSRDDIALASFLRSPLAGGSKMEDVMSAIRLSYPTKVAPCFHQALARYLAEKTDAITEQLLPIAAKIEAWRSSAQSKTVSELLWSILDETSYLPYLSGLPDGQQRIANVLSLYERAREFESFQQPTIKRFVDYLVDLENDDADQGLPPVPGAAVNAVKVMTIHRSKGLEFPVVIIPDLGKRINFRDGSEKVIVDESIGIATRVIDRNKMIHFPSLGSILGKTSLRQKSVAEELRVLYVAATRAKEHLILIGKTTQKAIDQWTDDWTGHTGPIPADYILTSSTTLDWIGPAMTIIEAENPQMITRQIHQPGDLDQLATQICQTSNSENIDPRCIALKPIIDPQLHAPELQSLVDRIAYQYPHQPDTQRPAAVSVSSITKGGKIARGGTDATIQPRVHFTPVLKMPRCLSGGKDFTAADAGTATHTVLQYFDFAKQLNDEYFNQLIQHLITQRVIRSEASSLVDFDAIRWFAGTQLGQKLAKPDLQIFRELDIAFPSPQGTGELVRGRIDLAIVEKNSLTIIDYKTDRVSAENMNERADIYRPQVEAYSSQLSRITGISAIESHLVFLQPRLILQIK